MHVVGMPSRALEKKSDAWFFFLEISHEKVRRLALIAPAPWAGFVVSWWCGATIWTITNRWLPTALSNGRSFNLHRRILSNGWDQSDVWPFKWVRSSPPITRPYYNDYMFVFSVGILSISICAKTHTLCILKINL